VITNPHAVSRLAKQRECEREPLGLLPLSLQHVKPHTTPRVPTNEERLRAFREALPAIAINAFPWAFRRHS
jgi:hypothetical protein